MVRGGGINPVKWFYQQNFTFHEINLNKLKSPAKSASWIVLEHEVHTFLYLLLFTHFTPINE